MEIQQNPQSFRTKLKTHKKAVITVGVIIAVIVGYSIYKAKAKSATPLRYVTAAVEQGTITSSVSGTGQVAASNQVDINPGSAGAVTSVNVKEGDTVKAGQILATLDETSASNQINSARAAVASAQANYDKLVAGTSADDIQLQQLSVQSAQQAVTNAQAYYQQVTKQQDLAIAKAYSNLLNDNLQANPSDSQSTGTITISGNYTGQTQGAYIITLYQASDGTHYVASGLGTGTGYLNRGQPEPLGNGLYVTFSTTGNFNPSTTWTINLPNVESSSYVNDENAYTTAQQNKAQALQQAQQQIDSAQNQLQQTTIQLKQKQEPPTQADIDTAKAQIQSAQVNLANAETTYANNIIKAPFDGIVAKLNIQKGQQATSGSAAVTLVTKQQIATITLNEVDAAKVQAGQKAILTFSAIPDLSISGEVGSVDTLGTVTQNVVNFTIKILFDTQDERVKPGMSVSADIITAVKQDVLMVPSAAIKSDNSGQSFVQTLVNGQPQNHTVTTGLTSNTNTEVSGDIKQGDEVITQTITATAAKTPTTGNTNILQSLGGRGATGGVGGGGGNRVFINGGAGAGAGK